MFWNTLKENMICISTLVGAKLKIISYNVNGIRSAIQKGILSWLASVDADIICLQEVKASLDQIDKSVFEEMGYHICWMPAEKKGYSGVAILSKKKPERVELWMWHFKIRC